MVLRLETLDTSESSVLKVLRLEACALNSSDLASNAHMRQRLLTLRRLGTGDECCSPCVVRVHGSALVDFSSSGHMRGATASA